MAPSYNYSDALTKSFLFYEAQRSGALPANNRISWRRNSALGDGSARYDANNNGQIDVGETLTRNLSEGYYDAGDYMKYAYPMASSMTLLSWGVNQYESAYRNSGQLDKALEAIKWGTDWLLKAHETSGSGSTLQTLRFWGQVGRTNTDHNAWVDDQYIAMPRPAYYIDPTKPGSDLAGEAAAALAAASIIFRSTNAAYAGLLLDHARALFKFAYQYQGLYSNSIPDAGLAYSSNNFNDDLAWGAIWLHKAVKASNGNLSETFSWANDQTYLQIAKSKNLALGRWTQTWGDKEYGAAILIAQEDVNYNRTAIESWLNYWTVKGSNGIPYTSGGLAFLDGWGSLRYAANTAFLAGIYSDTIRDYNGQYSNFSKNQIDYILGNNPRGSSYMVGFGNTYSRNPHHKSSHLNYNPLYNGTNGWTLFNNNSSNYNIIYGALVGGPASANDFDYQDTVKDYQRNEVALDYNAGLTGVLARLAGRSSPITPTINLSASQTIVEGQTNPQAVTYIVSLSAASTQIVTVNYTTTNGTAVSGADYTSISGTLSFAAGVTSQSVSIPILNDAINEANETFTLTLSSPTNASLGTSTSTTTITDTLTASVTTTLPRGVENLTLTGTGTINGNGNADNNIITGNSAVNQLNGRAGSDTLTGGGGNDIFVFQFGQSTLSVMDRMTDFAIGGDKIDLLTAAGAAMPTPISFSRAANNAAATLATVVSNVFTDANGGLAGNQALGLNSAALVVATTAGIAGTYLIINDGSAGYQSAQDLVINLTGYSGALPAIATITPSLFFV